jgi:hypothetical protein
LKSSFICTFTKGNAGNLEGLTGTIKKAKEEDSKEEDVKE